jgi:hypothetical protein
VPTEITEDVVREVALPLGFVDVKVCAIDEVWSGLKAVNMWIGVARAGYSVAEEFPIFLLIFAVPAAVAGLVSWKFS